MNCIEFRKVCLAEPDCVSTAFQAHQSNCVECSTYADEIRTTDEGIRQLMPMPDADTLKQRIKLRHSIQMDVDTRQRRTMFAAAATFLILMFGVLFTIMPRVEQQNAANAFQLAASRYVLEHPGLLNLRDRVADKDVVKLIKGFGGSLVHSPGSVMLAEVCQLQNRPAAHMVLDGEKGPVSVIYAQHVSPSSVSESVLADGRYKSLLAPADQGGLFVMGEGDEPLNQVLDNLNRSISW
ncbi:MAG: hypothetical protein ACI8P9_003701 [Parasphingorhabdus sp.]|jgi:hypothetical protein